jgi:phage terminase Nu1 subunit (DNA packaging protein)
MSIQRAPDIPASRRANKAEVAEFFGVSVPAVDGWIRRGCPSVQRGQRGVPWVFDLLRVAEWRFSKPTQDEGEVNEVPTAPADRLDHYRAERERISLEEKMGQLIPADEVRRAMSDMAKQMAATYDMLPDVLEREAGLNGSALAVVERVIDGQRYQLYEQVVDNDASDS